MSKICKTCGTTETSKWFSGPLCRRCYRSQPHIKERERQSRLKKIDHYRAVSKEYSRNNRDSIKEKNHEWYLNNTDRELNRTRKYRENNRDKQNAYENSYKKNRRNVDINFKICCNLRSRLSKAISGSIKDGSSVYDLGCSPEDLKQHLEDQFVEGMSWDNYGLHGWHIDHIRPLSGFDLSDPEELKEACHYTNLQPLWAQDNLSKGNR